jgi:hypothetical protein
MSLMEQTDGAPLAQPAEIGGDPGDKTASINPDNS